MAMIQERPDLREDHTMGILVAEHKILYERLDNMQAAGKFHDNNLRKRHGLYQNFLRRDNDKVIYYTIHPYISIPCRTDPYLLQQEAGGHPS